MVENSFSPLTDPISSMLEHSKLSYFSSDDVTGYFRPRPDFMVRIALKVPTMGGRYFDFLKKIKGQKVF